MIRHLFSLIWNRKGQNALLILEVIFASIILFAVMSFVLFNLDRLRQPLGFDTKPVWAISLLVPPDTDSLAISETRARLKTAVLDLPGVQTAAFSSFIIPFSGNVWVSSNTDMGFNFQTWTSAAGEGFADVLGLRLTAGRWPEEADYQDKYPPLVVNQLLADRYFRDSSMVGRIIRLNGEKRVLGVVEHYKLEGEFGAETPMSFLPLEPGADNGLVLLVRAADDAGPALEQSLDRAATDIAKGWDFQIQHLDEMRERDSREVWAPMIALLSVCAFLVINVALGLFGVLMYNINRRRPEIGLRMAAGASPRAIVGQFMLELLILAGLGVLIASVFAVQVPLLNLIEVPGKIYLQAGLATLGILFTLVTICTLYPSIQASRIQPAAALHED
ncbi:MAG: FtsX-like permease family protein [Bacteroidia bacterium]|nr:FtsX-like permease family protein [Bacteroidia bacterium]